MYKMIPFEEAKDNLATRFKNSGLSKEELSEITMNDTVLGINKSRWDKIMQGYMVDPDPMDFETMIVYRIFPTDRSLDTIQLPDFLLEKL